MLGIWRRFYGVHYAVLRLFAEYGLALVIIFMLQWLYPPGLTLPWQKVWGLSVGSGDRWALARLVEQAQSRERNISAVGGDTLKLSANDVGVVYNLEKLYQQAVPPRGLPISSVWKTPSNLQAVPLRVQDDAVMAVVAKLENSVTEPATNAVIVLQNGLPVIQSGSEGRRLSGSAYRRIIDGFAGNSKNIVIPTEKVSPDVSESALRPHLEELTALAQTEFDLDADGKHIVLAGNDLIAALALEKIVPGSPLPFDQTKLEGLLKRAVASQVDNLGTPLRITLRDGVEVSREAGVSGRVVDIAKTSDAVAGAIKTSRTQAKVVFAATTPSIQTAETYSKSVKGLEAAVKAWLARHPGKRAVYVERIDDPSFGIGINADEAMVPASTYKLFIGYQVLRKVQNGELKMTDGTPLGRTIAGCFDEMIIVSGDACAIYFQQRYGFQWMEDAIHADGFTQTHLNNSGGGNKSTTARQLALVLKKLYKRELLNDEQTNRFLDYLERQHYRKGIPSGVDGTLVADKVGFYDGWEHDAGIVFADHPYILVGMSRWGVFPEFAELARAVHPIMK